MRIDIVTLFPQMFQGPFAESIISRAVERQLLDIKLYNPRDYTEDKHHIVDDYPYGGGAGMVMKPEPLFETVEAVKALSETPSPVVLLTPQGRLFNQQIAQELAQHERIILVCGRYEGVDERVVEHLATDEISIGDYVLSGGEPAAVVVVDAVVRLLPGVLGSAESALDDSHVRGLLEYPQYTRPPEFRGWTVPPVLLSGNHAEVASWRLEQSLLRTLKRRPDLLAKATLGDKEKKILARLGEPS